ncbi:DUF362 domain-containing protein [Pseudomonadota bacterium]
MNDHRVSVVPQSSYDDPEMVYAAIKKTLEPLGGIEAFVKPGQRVLLKPNLVINSPSDPSAWTHPSVIMQTARLVKEAGAKEIFIGDSPGIGSVFLIAKKMGITPEMLQKIDAKLIDFREKKLISKKLENGRFETLSLSVDALEIDTLINLCKAKSHSQMVLTGAVKNLFGCVPGRQKALMHCMVKNNRYLFARMLIDVQRNLNASLHLMDGIVAMDGQGPTKGTARPWGWLLACKDPVALDTIMATALGYSIHEVPVLKAAKDMKFGNTDLQSIDLVGAQIKHMKPQHWNRAHMLPISFNPVRMIVSYLRHRMLTQLPT